MRKNPFPIHDAGPQGPLVTETTRLGIVLLAVAWSTSSLWGQEKLAKSTGPRHRTQKVLTLDRATAQQHPLWPALKMAVSSYQHIRQDVRDYSCHLVRRERVRGRVQPEEFIAVKVRHQRSRDGQVVIPFGVYLKVLAPSQVQGREVLFVDGKYDNMMLIRKGGPRFGFITTRLSLTSDAAMATNRYPLTEIGIENLVKRLIQVVKEDIRIGAETEVDFYPNASIDGRSCTAVKVFHPKYDARLRFSAATVIVDNELNVPVHYEAYDWPAESGGEPRLLEQYTYRNIELNPGFAEIEFDADNPDYSVK